MDFTDDVVAKAVAKALGQELWLARDATELSRAQFVTRLPSGIGDRTLLAYEHGLRQLTVLRLLELCEALGVVAATLLGRALQRACISVDNLTLQIDLRLLAKEKSHKFRPMPQWARNKLNRHPDGVAELTPNAVLELADSIGCSQVDLATYLAKFLPDPSSDSDAETDASDAHGASQ